MLHTRFPLDALMASVRGQAQSARMHKSRFLLQGLCVECLQAFKAALPWSFCQSRALLFEGALSLDSLPGDHARPAAGSAVSAGSSARAKLEGGLGGPNSGSSDQWRIGGLYPAALQPHTDPAAPYNTVRLSRRAGARSLIDAPQHRPLHQGHTTVNTQSAAIREFEQNWLSRSHPC